MTFFSDVNLSQKEIMDEYNSLIAQGLYNKANEFISQQKGVFSYSADFLNLIENRIDSLQTYLLTKKAKQPFVFSENEPTNVQINYIWI